MIRSGSRLAIQAASRTKRQPEILIQQQCTVIQRRQQRFIGTSKVLNNDLVRQCANSSSVVSFGVPCIGINSNSHRYYSGTIVVLKDYPPHTIYPMPALSPTMDVGSIVSWNISVGDEFTAGTSLCTIETDKASVDFEAQDDGIIAKILREGSTALDMKIGTPICVVVENSDDVAAFSDYVLPDDIASTATAAGTPTAPTVSPTSTAAVAATQAPSGSSVLLPSARHLAESNGLDATVLLGTGKGGRVTKGDVIQAMEIGTLPPLAKKQEHQSSATTVVAAAASTITQTVTPQAPAVVAPTTTGVPVTYSVPEIDDNNTYTDLPNNKMRKIIASRLTESKRDVPHFYTSMDVELDNIMKLRKSLASIHDVKVSVNDFIIRCSALALRDVPEVNATFDVKTNAVIVQGNIDISVAVATPTGLITPIVFGTDRLGLSAISNTVKDLATRARDGKLAPHEFQGGSFTISNLGMFGIDEFSAVINPPQAAILAVGGGTKKFIPTPYIDGASTQDAPKIKTIMTARLSADRRVVDEAIAAQFVQALRYYINTPELLLL